LKSDKYLERPLTRVRRKDRVLADEEWLDRLLAVGAMGSIAIVYDGQPMIHTNL
jgi:nitroimidazol reductase NimA-like FMN-containing flavoprotein (pyridoxamine 5'-phosphate oxidase superfamily)